MAAFALGTDFESPPVPDDAEKIGAGILMTTLVGDAIHVLLLRRNSKHNDNSWGLPGGNLDKGETLPQAAVRETLEEISHVPTMSIIGNIITRRGKHGQKFYAVFVAYMTEETKQAYNPTVDPEEHHEYKWFNLADLSSPELPLHPVAQIIVYNTDNLSALKNMVAEGAKGSRALV